ncbi:unnamed protein product [Mytilus coruscus]|uniref:Uncharacterized protein n=1 Tax=Mytilus coruscus TaxID=42192 RepID=A0A6J8EIW7_MYTCO|nr:unnamed protein product [Mytilus coruscus]
MHNDSSTSSGRSQVLLKTAIAPITYDKTQFTSTNILFDEGAQRSFITKEMANLLNLRPHKKEAITISDFGESNKKVRNLQIDTIYLKGLMNTLIPIEVLIVPQIAYPIHTYARNQSSFPHLNGLKLLPALQDEDFEVLPNNLVKSWCEILDDIRDVTVNTKIARHYFNDENENESNEKITLHVFVDASQIAYGASAYLCKGNTSSLVIAKHRIAPLAKMTSPKLELMAAVLGARMAKHLTKTLEPQRTVLWSDSQIVLHWISSSKTFGRFVQNRVLEIKETTQNYGWKYVPTESNPADLQTRGISSTQFKESTLRMQ